MVAWKRPSGGGGWSSTVMNDRSRSSGGVSWALANPSGPTGRTRVPSHGGAAVAFPTRVAAGLGEAAAGDAVRAAGAVVVAGAPEQAHRAAPRTAGTASRAARRSTLTATSP